MTEPDFDDLLHEAELMECEAERIGKLPHIERSLRQLPEAANDLLSRVTSKGALETEGNLFFASKGIDMPALAQKIDSLSARKTFEPLEPIHDKDIQNFLKNERENAILSLIENTHRHTYNVVERKCMQAMFQSWENEKRKLLNSFVGNSVGIVELPVTQEFTTLNESKLTHSPMDQYEMAYAQALISYNLALLNGDSSQSLVDKFATAVAPFHDSKVNEMWSMVKYMSEVSLPQSTVNGEFSRALPQVQNEMITQARKYLENRYQIFMNTKVSQSLAEVTRGVPGTYSLVTAFLRVQISSGIITSLGLDDLQVDNLPYWVLLYYLLRCGDVDSAITATNTLGPGMSEMHRVLVDLKDNGGGKLSSKMEKLVRNQYKPYVRNSSDPYKRLIYSALGACAIGEDHNEVIATADDYLWLKLLQVRAPAEGIILRDSHAATAADTLPYDILQMMISEEYGESYYEDNSNRSLYFQMLLLSGQLEAAVEFVVRNPSWRCHGVHMGIGLLTGGLLAVSGSTEAPLISIESTDPPPARRLNPARLITLYTNKFEQNEPRTALHYYFTLRDLDAPGPAAPHNLFAACVSALALQTRDFASLFGALDGDGCLSSGGLIHEFGSRESDIRAVILFTAEALESKSEFTDAIELFELGGNQEKALSLMSTCLSQVVSRSSQLGDPTRSRLYTQAQGILERISTQSIGAYPATVRTFHILVDLFAFFDAFADGQHTAALDMIQRSGLIPLSPSEIDEKVANFKKLDERVTKNIADILFATMTMVHAEFKKLKEETNWSALSTNESNKKKQFLRERASALTSFTGAIPFRIPGDISRKLILMGIYIN